MLMREFSPQNKFLLCIRVSVNEINYGWDGWETQELIRYKSRTVTPTIKKPIKQEHRYYVKFSLGEMCLSNIVLLKTESYTIDAYIPA